MFVSCQSIAISRQLESVTVTSAADGVTLITNPCCKVESNVGAVWPPMPMTVVADAPAACMVVRCANGLFGGGPVGGSLRFGVIIASAVAWGF